MPDQSPVFTNITYFSVQTGTIANAIAVATIPAVAGKTAYITGFTITSSGATAALVVTPTIVGVATGGGNLTYSYSVVAGVTLANALLQEKFSPALPAVAPNTQIQVVLPALGAGNTNATIVATGFYQ